MDNFEEQLQKLNLVVTDRAEEGWQGCLPEPAPAGTLYVQIDYDALQQLQLNVSGPWQLVISTAGQGLVSVRFETTPDLGRLIQSAFEAVGL